MGGGGRCGQVRDLPLHSAEHRLQPAGHHHLHQLCQHRRGGGDHLLLQSLCGEQRRDQRIQQYRQRQGQGGHSRRAPRDHRQFLRQRQAPADMGGGGRCGQVRDLPLHPAEHRLHPAGHHHLHQLRQHRRGGGHHLLLQSPRPERGRRGGRVQQYRQRRGQGGGSGGPHRDHDVLRQRQAEADVERRQRRCLLPGVPL